MNKHTIVVDGETYSKGDNTDMFQIGEKYLIRTVTMALTGRLIKADDKFLKLEDAAWIADTGRFSDALKTGVLNEIEPFPSFAIVAVGSIVDAAPWVHALPREQK